MEVYVDIPPRLGPTSETNKVCRLKKGLYELKQSH